jgi:quercetin dioxygenase-like cupin family protein
MSKFFPTPTNIKMNADVELIVFECESTIVQLVYVAAGATFALHQHLESQMGMIISGGLRMNVNGIEEVLKPLEKAYIANADVPHGSVNIFAETALVFDVKRTIPALKSAATDRVFLKAVPKIDEVTGFPCQSVVADWFEITIVKIPPGGMIPLHQSASEQMGIVLNGELRMMVGGEEAQLKYGRIYYAPGDVLYGGNNCSDEVVTLVEILMPPCADRAEQDANFEGTIERSLTAN